MSMHTSHPSREERKSVKLTVGRRSWLVPTEMLRRTRRRVETWRALWATAELWRHAMRRIGVLRRRGQARAALVCTACHYTTEKVARPVSNLRRLRLRRAMVVRALAGTTTLFKFTFKLGDFILVSTCSVSMCFENSRAVLNYFAFI